MTTIEWTDVTEIVDRGGRRVRTYQRYGNLARPGQQARRARLALGQKWCRGCADWLPVRDVLRQGVCQQCANAEYRAQYAANGQPTRARVYARKRSILPMPAIGVEALTEKFGGMCAYCPARATTWDHVVPVASGGDTLPGNIVPACRPCNSSKGAKDVFDWLERTGRTPSDVLIDALALIADEVA